MILSTETPVNKDNSSNEGFLSFNCSNFSLSEFNFAKEIV